MSGWWVNSDWHPEESEPEEVNESTPPYRQQTCAHSWKPILLITSTVYNCEKCDIHKEVYDEWVKSWKM